MKTNDKQKQHDYMMRQAADGSAPHDNARLITIQGDRFVWYVRDHAMPWWSTDEHGRKINQFRTEYMARNYNAVCLSQ